MIKFIFVININIVVGFEFWLVLVFGNCFLCVLFLGVDMLVNCFLFLFDIVFFFNVWLEFFLLLLIVFLCVGNNIILFEVGCFVGFIILFLLIGCVFLLDLLFLLFCCFLVGCLFIVGLFNNICCGFVVLYLVKLVVFK